MLMQSIVVACLTSCCGAALNFLLSRDASSDRQGVLPYHDWEGKIEQAQSRNDGIPRLTLEMFLKKIDTIPRANS